MRALSTFAVTTLIALASAGCVPSPFAQQEVPQTTYTTDADGNTVKVSVNTDENMSTPQQIQAVTEEFYEIILDKDFNQQLIDGMQASDAKNKKEAITDVMKLAHPVLENIHAEESTDEELVNLILTYSMLASISEGSIEAEVPLHSINVNMGTQATVDQESIQFIYEGEKLDNAATKDAVIHLVKKDGEWLLDGDKLVEEIQTLSSES